MVQKIWKSSGLGTKSFKQVALLFASYLALIVLGFALKHEQTFILGEDDYGKYALVISITGILALIFHFGYFISLQVLLASNENADREKKFLGAGFIVALGIGVLLASAAWLLAEPAANFFQSDIADLMRILAPLFAVLPINNLLYAYGSGTNKLGVNMSVNIIPKVLFLVSLLFFKKIEAALGVEALLRMNLLSSIIAFATIVLVLKPDFSDLKKSLGILNLKNKRFGIKYYSGALVNQTTYRLDEICIGYFVSPAALGIYSLANMICSPMLLLSQSLSTAMFKRFSKMDRIPPRIFIYNTIWLIGCILFFVLTGKMIVDLLFPPEFNQVADYLLPISLVLLVHASTTPFSFLVAKSKGEVTRNIAWAEAAVNISGNLILIPLYGIIGAVIASFLAKSVHLGMLIWYYRRFQANLL